MLQFLKFVWVVAVLINLSAIIWFILGTTANFQRGIDLISTFILTFFGIPSILLIILSIILFIRKWSISSLGSIALVSIIIICLLSLSPTLFKYVNTSGWLSENVTTDTLQTTVDGQYEYQFELINVFQKNSNARLYIKRIDSGEEVRIPLDIPVNRIYAFSTGEENRWVIMEGASEKNKYIMRTTFEFPLREERNEKYKIDLDKKEAVKMK